MFIYMTANTHGSIYCFYTPHFVLTDERYILNGHMPAQHSISSESGCVEYVHVSDDVTLQTKMFFKLM